MIVLSGPAEAVGAGDTVTVTVAVAEQLEAFDTVNVYCVVEGGDAIGFGTFELLNPVAGCQV